MQRANQMEQKNRLVDQSRHQMTQDSGERERERLKADGGGDTSMTVRKTAPLRHGSISFNSLTNPLPLPHVLTMCALVIFGWRPNVRST